MARTPWSVLGPVLLTLLAPASAQVPPQAVPILKKVGAELVDKLLKPKMQVEYFNLGGFKATRVEPDGDATPENFSGSALFELPAPLGPQKLTFKGLVLKGTTAEGTLDQVLKDASGELRDWHCTLTRVVLSDKGSRLEGTAVLGGMKLDLAPLTLTPQGLTGTLSPGDLLLAEGPFEAVLQAGEVTFTPSAIMLKGNLDVRIDPPVRHAVTGAELKLDGGAVAFDSSLIKGSGLVGNLGSNIPLFHKGQTWIVQSMALAFERGTPILGGPTRLQFPLQVFCRVGATDQPYVSDAIPCHLRGKVPAPAAPTPTAVRLAARRPSASPAALEFIWEGFSGSFPLPAASLHPSGLTSYRVDVANGVARVEKGQLTTQGTTLSGSLAWGSSFTYSVPFKDAPASLADGLYLVAGSLNKVAEVGAYRVHKPFGSAVADFSPSLSPEGLPENWMGVFLPSYALALPIELYTLNSAKERLPVLVSAKAGRFEANGSFSGDVAAELPKEIILHIAPVKIDPFELHFVEGAVIHGPVVTATMNLTAKPLLDPFTPPVKFHLTQNGVEQVEIVTQTPSGAMAFPTCLVGISMVVDSAILHPTNLDFTGRFDLAVAGADLPSISFDHLVMEASGAGIDGSHDDLSFEFKGSRWSGVPDRPHVSLWGYPFGLGETGYGVLGDGRFYVGLGGDFEVNPLLPIEYNRIFFTTAKEDEGKGTLELEKLFDIDQSVASLGSLKASLGFQVETANNAVKDAYFLGTGKLDVAMGDAPFHLDAGMRFGRSYQGSSYFPYFYALGHFQTEGAGVQVAPDLEVYGLAGGLAQNFMPDEIRNTTDVKGKPDNSLGIAVMAGVDAGTSDKFTFHGGLDLYISQNFTTLLQGKGWLFCGRDKEPEDNQVTADIRFTRNPNTFDATLTANLNLYEGLLRPMGEVQLHFGPDKQFVHIGTKEAPILVRVKDAWDASGYMTADFQGGTSTFGAGAAFSYSKEGDFGIIWGNAWLNARGDLIIEIDADRNPHFLGTLMADGGASFGMKFETFWHTYKVTIFSGSIGANLAFQVPGSPTLSGSVSIHYSVLGGLFSGSVGARLDM